MYNNYENLKNEVMEILESMAVDSSFEEVVEEVLEHGCVTGIVGSLMYYYQTKAFFDRHKDAINELAHELSEDIYGNKYSIYKNLQYECNKNTMAWFGFEEMTRVIAEEMEIGY